MSSSSANSFGEVDNGEFEIVRLTEDDLGGALHVMKESFFLKESLCVATEFHLPGSEAAHKDILELCRDIFTHGVSLIARHKSTREVAAVAFNFIHVTNEPNHDSYLLNFKKYRCHTPKSIALLDLMLQLDAAYDFCENFKADCFIEIMFLATLSKFEGRKIAKSLCIQSVKIARDLYDGKSQQYLREVFRAKRIQGVFGLMTAYASQRIAATIEMKVFYEMPYNKLKCDGVSIADKLYSSGPPTIQFAAIVFN